MLENILGFVAFIVVVGAFAYFVVPGVKDKVKKLFNKDA